MLPLVSRGPGISLQHDLVPHWLTVAKLLSSDKSCQTVTEKRPAVGHTLCQSCQITQINDTLHPFDAIL